MKRSTIPGTDLTVAAICYGTSSIGSKQDEATSFRMLDAYVEAGGNFIDTALNYADWMWPVRAISEKTIGKWLRTRADRDQLVVATKGACPTKERFFRVTPEDIRSDLEASLRHLQVDCIPLYWLHRDDPSIPIETIVDTLNAEVRAGRIRYFGCSNWTLPRIIAAAQYAKANGLQTFCANQMMWSLSATTPESLPDETIVLMDEETKAYHTKEQLAAIPFSSQASGFFSGRYSREGGAPTGRASFVNQYWTETNLQRLDRVHELARQLHQPPAVIALAYLLAHPFPTHPIIGASSIEQIQESCMAAQCELDAGMIRYLEQG